MPIHPIENEYDLSPNSKNVIENEIIGSIVSSSQWTIWRDDLTRQMVGEWIGNCST